MTKETVTLDFAEYEISYFVVDDPVLLFVDVAFIEYLLLDVFVDLGEIDHIVVDDR